MFYVLIALVALGVWLFCLFDVLTTDEADVRGVPRFGWFLIVLLGLWLGAALWVALGRPRAVHAEVQTWPGDETPARPDPPRGPDDDPEFLRNLGRRIHGED
ncbi:MAG TPA: hypothetical protein VGP70_01485 [Actinomadura sp.]|jgi:hypothetical protein|nr:hypothetical protein [Actinomadura sp.]